MIKKEQKILDKEEQILEEVSSPKGSSLRLIPKTSSGKPILEPEPEPEPSIDRLV